MFLYRRKETIWAKTEDLKTIYLNVLPVHDDKYIKTKIKANGNKAYTNFVGLNVLKDNIECEYFTDISINYLLVYNKNYYLQVFLDNFACKIKNK